MSMFSQGADSERRLARIEAKLDLVLKHLNIESPGPDLAPVVKLIRAGKRLEAIKLYRELTGAGLKEAKEAVEELASRS